METMKTWGLLAAGGLAIAAGFALLGAPLQLVAGFYLGIAGCLAIFAGLANMT
jgi:hypothetical protein